jgi:uncharacterized membrane protein
LASKINDFFGKTGTRYIRPRTPDMLEKICGGLALVLLGCVAVAVFKGRPHWEEIPWTVWVHLVSLIIVLALTPIMMWRKRGDDWHRLLGWIWSFFILLAAVISFVMTDGRFSLIHILSVLVVVGVPVLVLSARRRDIARHRGQARGFVIGALLIAGFFTFPFGRLLGTWFFS